MVNQRRAPKRNLLKAPRPVALRKRKEWTEMINAGWVLHFVPVEDPFHFLETTGGFNQHVCVWRRVKKHNDTRSCNPDYDSDDMIRAHGLTRGVNMLHYVFMLHGDKAFFSPSCHGNSVFFAFVVSGRSFDPLLRRSILHDLIT